MNIPGALNIIRRLPLPGQAEANALLVQNERLTTCECPLFGRPREDCPAEKTREKRAA